MLRGLKLDFKGAKMGKDQHVGAQFNAKNIGNWTTVSGDVSVGITQASTVGGGPFRARVYRKSYKNAAGTAVGSAYAVLNQEAIDAAGAGGGMWVLLGPLLVAVCCALIIFQANQASTGAKSLAATSTRSAAAGSTCASRRTPAARSGSPNGRPTG